MSCYVVSDQHISAILGGVSQYRDRDDPEHDFDPIAVGRMLLKANCDSVEARYPGERAIAISSDVPQTSELFELQSASADEGGLFALDEQAFKIPLTPIETVKLIDCLMYQCCEHPEWENSKAYKWLIEAKLRVVSHNPEWDSANWSI